MSSSCLGRSREARPSLQAWKQAPLAAAAGRVAVDLALGGEWSTREVPTYGCDLVVGVIERGPKATCFVAVVETT